MQTVGIESGFIRGMKMGEDGKEIYVYRGIPYADSTAGVNRWRPPQPAKAWKYVRDCTEYMEAAPQDPAGPPFPQKNRGDDCLSLNVLTPTQESSAGLPVMVWLHGGGYSVGCANNRLYNSIALPQKGVVLVTVNHRLGLMGLMAHPLLSAESEKGVSGNYMFLDILASLKWVQHNIQAFGGDPGNITVFGESGGGGKVAGLMASPLAAGLFQRAICQSGTGVNAPIFAGKKLAALEETGQKLFAKMGAAKVIDPLKMMREIPWPQLLEAERSLAAESGGSGRPTFTLWDAAIDGYFLPAEPTAVFKSGRHNAVPLIAGANLGELTTGMVRMPWIINSYKAMAEGNLKAGSTSFLYIFDRVPVGWQRTGMHSIHGLELNYLFGLAEHDWENVFPGPANPDPELNEADRMVGENMRLWWSQFASTGHPGTAGQVNWPAWEAGRENYLYIAEPPAVRKSFSSLPGR